MRITRSFAEKRIIQQVNYMVEVALSDRTDERKSELFKSAFYQAKRFLDVYPNDLSLLFLFATQMATLPVMISKRNLEKFPKPSHPAGGFAIVGERGPEIILSSQEPKSPISMNSVSLNQIIIF